MAHALMSLIIVVSDGYDLTFWLSLFLLPWVLIDQTSGGRPGGRPAGKRANSTGAAQTDHTHYDFARLTAGLCVCMSRDTSDGLFSAVSPCF